MVGGGVTGAATAWDAAQRGLSVALVERDDFGGATSANSLKVIHGGIRYLQHLDIPRVRESCRERSAWLRTDLGGAVRRLRLQWVFLVDRYVLRSAVDLARGGVDHPSHAAIAGCRAPSARVPAPV